MSLADFLNIGRTTKRYLANILMTGILFGIIEYWYSSSQDEEMPQGISRRNIQAPGGLQFKRKWNVSKDNALIPGKLQQTTPVIIDHTAGESEPGDRKKPGDQNNTGDQEKEGIPQTEAPKQFSLQVTDDQINTFNMVSY